MTVYNKVEKPPKHILKRGDLLTVKKNFDKIDGVSGVVVGGLTVGAVSGAVYTHSSTSYTTAQ